MPYNSASIDNWQFPYTADCLLKKNQQKQTAIKVGRFSSAFLKKIVRFIKNIPVFSAAEIQKNREFKVSFVMALAKAEGWDVAEKAMCSVGLKPGWSLTSKPLSQRKAKKIICSAQHIRHKNIILTEKNLKLFLNATTPPSFFSVFVQERQHTFLTAEVPDADLIASFRLAVKQNLAVEKRPLCRDDLIKISQHAIHDFYSQKEQLFEEMYPSLARFSKENPEFNLGQDLQTTFDKLTAKICGMDQIEERDALEGAITALKSNERLLKEIAFDPDAIQQLTKKLYAASHRLQDLGNELTALYEQITPAKNDHILLGNKSHQWIMALIHDIGSALQRQEQYLSTKAAFLEEIRNSDPFSEKMVSYNNLLWAYSAEIIIDNVVSQLHPQHDIAKIATLRAAAISYLNEKKCLYQTSSPTQRLSLPDKKHTHTHPVLAGKQETITFLSTTLARVGYSKKQCALFINRKTLHDARLVALNQKQRWVPIVHDMVVARAGVLRSYRSHLIPASAINARFKRQYSKTRAFHSSANFQEGVSSSTTNDLWHARNLKVSRLERIFADGRVDCRVQMVSHGILDMWGITDPVARQTANQRAAKEVLEGALSLNQRVCHTALTRAASHDTTPVKMTHVNVNLTTPTRLSELPFLRKKFSNNHERIYTAAHFAAFATHSGGAVQCFELDDERCADAIQEDVKISVCVDVISFSFPINPLATGRWQHLLGGWRNVEAHNKANMIKFIGDPGSGKWGASGLKPAGFIGTIYDLLDANNPAEALLKNKIQAQTDLVREMFCSESFKKSNGDAAKMGRHILVLQNLAEQVLAHKNIVDQAATMSKGCKSDKDRGGVTDVELKHFLVTEDMGGQITPDMKLVAEDANNYYAIAARSGQFENQIYNTGLPGSKEAKKQSGRLPSWMRCYLSGLSCFVKE